MNPKHYTPGDLLKYDEKTWVVLANKNRVLTIREHNPITLRQLEDHEFPPSWLNPETREVRLDG